MRRSENCWLVATTVTFNIKDPHQLSLLEFAETMPNYSGTIKRLLAAQMTGVGTNTPDTHAKREDGATASRNDDFEWDPVNEFL